MPTVLACPSCRTGALARRGDPLCLTCMKASREIPSWPFWVFDSLLLRDALAQVNLAAVPAIVRAACGLSQRDLASIAGWSPAALSYYERGQRDAVFDIRTLLQFADAIGMPRSVLLPLILADPDAALTAGPWHGTDLDADGCGAVVRAAASASHLRYWAACTDALYVQDRVVGGTALLRPALRQWQFVRRTLPGPGADAGADLLAMTGEVALCAGWMALDGGRLPLARSLYAEARELARTSGETMLAVHALTSLSMLYAEMAGNGPSQESARRALRLSFQAAEEGRYLPVSRLHALVALRRATAASLLGDKAAFQAGISQARREMDRGQHDDDPPEWLRFVDEVEVTGVEARGYLNLGDADRSALLFRQVLAAKLSARSRADYGAGLANVLLRQGTHQHAVAAAEDVLLALEGGVTSIRCLNRLRLVRRVAQDAIGANDFCKRFDAVERVLAAPHVLPSDDAPLARVDVPALFRRAVLDVADE